MGKIRFHDNCRHLHKLHYGSGMPVFRGDYRQEGYGIGGIISNLMRSIIPMITPAIKTVGKSLAKTAIKTGTKVLSDVVSNRRTFKDAVRHRVGETLANTLTDNTQQATDTAVSGAQKTTSLKARVSRKRRAERNKKMAFKRTKRDIFS